ncbi:hypothetical protein TrST_g7321 [Triparma strigata]|uniref:RNA exonuclease 4 n=1 Tax=Triparma strigata TaxID=1606541 RepID=A0A9W7EUE8_9STRA|nr:hypothetical protein TrST_g7321 [Triparma strigata]
MKLRRAKAAAAAKNSPHADSKQQEHEGTTEPTIKLSDPTASTPNPSGFRIIKSTKKSDTKIDSKSPKPSNSSTSASSDPLSNTIIKVTIPSNLTGPALRTFRKKSRRLAKQKLGPSYTDSSVVFRSSSTLQKRKFASINDAVKKSSSDALKASEDLKKLKRTENLARKISSQQPSDSDKSLYVGLDCEMVGVGSSGSKSVLARVSLTDYEGKTLLDTHVKVSEKVTDFRTHVSGIRPSDIKNKSSIAAVTLRKAQEMVIDVIEGKVVVGHGLSNDFKCLMIDHPKYMIRDTAKFRPYMRKAGTGKYKPRKLRDLVKDFLGEVGFQEGKHDSCEDAHAAMKLYRLKRGEWEREMEEKAKKSKKRVSKGTKGGFKNVDRDEEPEVSEEDSGEE